MFITAPSGHILTNLELQALGILLSAYTDEKLEALKRSVQERSQGENIMREVVEMELRQSGHTLLANDLKERLDKGELV